VTSAGDDVIELNGTTADVIMTSSNDSDSHKSQSQYLDNYSVWTARMNEANAFLWLK